MGKNTQAAPPTSLIKYEPYSEEDAADDAEDIKKARKSGAFHDLDQGKNVLRFLPALAGKKWKRVTYVHWVSAAGTGERTSFVCPRLEAKRPCTLCKHEQQLRATGSDLDTEKAKKLQAKRRCFSNVVVRGKEEDGPKVFAYGTMIEEQLIDLRKDENVDFLNPTSDGCDITVLKKGEAMSTKYKVKEGEFCSLSDDVKKANEWLQGQHDLERFAKVLDDEDIDAILRGERPGQDDADEKEERPRPQRASRTVSDEVDDGVVDDDEDEKEDKD